MPGAKSSFLLRTVRRRLKPLRSILKGAENRAGRLEPFRQGFADDGGYASAEELGGVEELGVGEGGDAHLKADAGDAAEGFVHLEELGGYGFGVAD